MKGCVLPSHIFGQSSFCSVSPGSHFTPSTEIQTFLRVRTPLLPHSPTQSDQHSHGLHVAIPFVGQCGTSRSFSQIRTVLLFILQSLFIRASQHCFPPFEADEPRSLVLCDLVMIHCHIKSTLSYDMIIQDIRVTIIMLLVSLSAYLTEHAPLTFSQSKSILSGS